MVHDNYDQPKEGKLTKAIEKQTAKIPSLGYLTLALGAMAISAGIEVFSKKERKDWGAFVGLWAPTLLIMGIYNKIVKIEGSDQTEQLQKKAA